MAQINNLEDARRRLKKALEEIGATAKKLSPHEFKAAKDQLDIVEELIRRVETGYIWISFFGKVNVGKSSVGNSLLDQDVFIVSPLMDATDTVHYRPIEDIKVGKFMLVDVPGTLGKGTNEQTAQAEAQKAHGLIFVLDGEPLEAELQLFDFVKREAPKTPILVFVNQEDVLKLKFGSELSIVKQRIKEKMAKYVDDPDKDILYGSARRRRDDDKSERLPIKHLMDRLYEDPTAFGTLMNIIDPAERAEKATAEIRSKILAIREETARKVIRTYAMAAVAAGALPFDQIANIPALTILSVYIAKIMGKADDAGSMKEHTVRVWKEVVPKMWKDFLKLALWDAAFSVFGLLTGTSVWSGIADAFVLGKERWAKMMAFGETVLELTKNDFDWTKVDVKKILRECKKRAEEEYQLFRIKQKPTPEEV